MIERVYELSAGHVEQLHALYQNEWWSKGRTLEETHLAVAHSSVVIGLVDETARLVGFCRIVTDFVFHGGIYDVIVAPDQRGRGLGRELMSAVSEHPQLQRVRSLRLCCVPEMVPFYNKWGFGDLQEVVMMQKIQVRKAE